jgi:pilus assembly protein CpaF
VRIEYVNTVTGKGGARDLPAKLNPVWIGNHPKNHVVLDSPYVGPEAGAFDNDVAGREGWRFWNRNGRPMTVDGVVLGGRNEYVRVRGPRVVIDCWPYVLTASFAPDELATTGDDVRRLDGACATLVRDVHQALVHLHPEDPADRAEWLKDGYLYELEQQVAALAAGRPDFPTDDLAVTALGQHLAGVAVRSMLVQQLVAEGGDRDHPPEPAAWDRFRSAVPDLEAELGRLAAAAAAALGLAGQADLSDRMRRIEAGFWDFWEKRLAKPGVPPRLARYLAIRRLTEEVKDVWYGYGPLEDLIDDPTVTEVMVVGPDKIFIEKDGQVELSGRLFLTDPVTVIQRIMAHAGRQVNTAQPLADARMADGSRVNAVLDPLAVNGPHLTIRRFPPRRLTVDDLVGRLGALTPAARDFLRAAVVNRRNVLVSGGTGTGKTTLLNCLSGFIPDKDRIVTIEDTAELQLQKEHVVSMQARPANTEGAGQVTIRDLVRNALRMRPDRIVVGECRGGEAIDMLQAMNTGHDGSMTTLHANSPDGAVRRLEVLVQQNADAELPVGSIHQQIASAIDLIVQLGVVIENGRKRKVVTEITEVSGYDAGAGGVQLVSLFARETGRGLAPTGSLPTFLPDLIAHGLVPDPVAFVRG